METSTTKRPLSQLAAALQKKKLVDGADKYVRSTRNYIPRYLLAQPRVLQSYTYDYNYEIRLIHDTSRQRHC